jgi:hypothetical protein
VKLLAVALFAAVLTAASATAAPQKNNFTFRAPTGIRCGVFVPGKYSEALLRCRHGSSLSKSAWRRV